MKPLIIAVLLMTVAFISHAQNNETKTGNLNYNSNQGIQSKNVSDTTYNYLPEEGKRSYGQKAVQINSNDDTIRRREYTSQDSLRLTRFKRISPIVPENHSEEIRSEQTQKPSAPKKVKNVVNSQESEEAGSVKLPELDQIIAQYQENQKEIKLAKSKNDLNTLEDLEKKSTSIKSNYVSIYKSIDSNNLNPEYRRFYEDFEKDILNK